MVRIFSKNFIISFSPQPTALLQGLERGEAEDLSHYLMFIYRVQLLPGIKAEQHGDAGHAIVVPMTAGASMHSWKNQCPSGIRRIGLSDMSVEAMPTGLNCTAASESVIPMAGPTSAPLAIRRKVRGSPSATRVEYALR